MTSRKTPSASTVLIFAAYLIFAQGHKVVRRSESNSCPKKFTLFPGHSACLQPSPDLVKMELTPTEMTAIVAKHNDFRSKVSPAATNMMKMSWDDEVAMVAQRFLDSCPFSDGSLSHDKGYNRFIPGRFQLGQNLAAGHTSMTAAIEDWHAEQSDYESNTPKSEQTKVVGHYTQVVWAESIKIGCGLANCAGTVVYGCNYAPPGNVNDFTTPYEIGVSGASCKTNTNGLCDCGNLACENGKVLDPSTCTCDCGGLKEPECSLDCNITESVQCTNTKQKSECTGSSAPSVTSICPQFCEICPFAEKGYVETNDDNDDGDDGDDNDGDDNDGDDDDDSASSIPVSYLSLVIIASFVTYTTFLVTM